jgi:hypothetical protein
MRSDQVRGWIRVDLRSRSICSFLVMLGHLVLTAMCLLLRCCLLTFLVFQILGGTLYQGSGWSPLRFATLSVSFAVVQFPEGHSRGTQNLNLNNFLDPCSVSNSEQQIENKSFKESVINNLPYSFFAFRFRF